jgi:hypothetical protein
MTAGPGPEGEKAGLSRPRAARPEGLALRPGRPRVQRPDACAAPETKGEPAWLGPGDSSGEISASGGVPGCAPPANRSKRTEERCLSERTVERDFHMPGRGDTGCRGQEGPRAGLSCCGGKDEPGFGKADCWFFGGCSEDGSDGSGAEDWPAESGPDPVRGEDRRARRTAWHRSAGGESHTEIRERREGQGREKRTPIRRGSCSSRSRQRRSRPVLHRQAKAARRTSPWESGARLVCFAADCEALLCAPRSMSSPLPSSLGTLAGSWNASHIYTVAPRACSISSAIRESFCACRSAN